MNTSNRYGANLVPIRQLIDYYLIDELVNDRPRGYIKRIQYKLAEHKLHYSKVKIQAHAQKAISGKHIIKPAAVLNNQPSIRLGKEENYAGFWTLVDIGLPCVESRRYVGLAANQLDTVQEKVIQPVVVCERDKSKANKLKKYAKFLSSNRISCSFTIHNTDIFKHLGLVNEQYNIYDLDLMSFLPSRTVLKQWAQSIYDSALVSPVVINLTACIGRGITEKEHRMRVEILRDSLEEVGFQEHGHSQFAYRDKVIPMRAERFILTKGD